MDDQQRNLKLLNTNQEIKQYNLLTTILLRGINSPILYSLVLKMRKRILIKMKHKKVICVNRFFKIVLYKMLTRNV